MLELGKSEKLDRYLYIWLVRQYPHNEDPDYSNEVMAHFVSVRESMGNLRDSVLSQLKERATLQSCAEIQRLIQEFPDVKIENEISSSNPEKRFDWKFWLTIATTLTVALISVAASGVFNDEIKKLLFNRSPSPQVEQKLEKRTN